MRKRLKGIITSQEQTLKDDTFRELQYNDLVINFNGQDFVGVFYNIENDKYLFVGVDKRLLSYQGFITYTEFEKDIEEKIQNNVYILYKDGILIIEINNIKAFSNIVSKDEIKNYQDNITISDIDEMNEISFVKYFKYLLNENGFLNLREQLTQISEKHLYYDLAATKENRTYYFEFKIIRSKKISGNILEQIFETARHIDTGKIIFVTNAIVDDIEIGNNIIKIIDREKLSKLIKNSHLLTNYIKD